jgi:hypothetical protein
MTEPPSQNRGISAWILLYFEERFMNLLLSPFKKVGGGI